MRVALVFVAVALLSATALCGQVFDRDLPNFPGSYETIYSCSVVIPMDEKQYDENGVFNLATYGLVTHLLWSDIPVEWIIRSGKQHNEWDFNATAWEYYPQDGKARGDDPQFMSFRGGPFVVRTQWLQFAKPFMDDYLRNHTNLKLFKLAETVQADVRYSLLKKPKVAILDSSRNNIVQRQILIEAGFQPGLHYEIFTKEEANNLTAGTCITAASEPHFHSETEYYRSPPELQVPQYETRVFTSALRKFVESGGNFLAQCGGISTYENCDQDQSNTEGMNQDRSELPVNCTDGLFMTDRGLNIATSLPNQETCHSRNANSDPSDDEECPSIYLNSDTPVAQFTGEWEWYGGSVKVMTTWNQTYDANRASHTENTSFNAANRAHGVVGFTSSLENHERNLYVVMHAKLAQFHGKLGGNIFYLTGHRYYDIIKSLDPSVCPHAPSTGEWQCPETGSYCINNDDDCHPIFRDMTLEQCYAQSQAIFGVDEPCEVFTGGKLYPGRQVYLNAILHPADRDPACKFDVDSCKWGVCDFLKKRNIEEINRVLEARKRGIMATLQSSNITVTCDCERTFDCAGNCGGDGTPEGLCELVAGAPGAGGNPSTGAYAPATVQPTGMGGSGTTPSSSVPVPTNTPSVTAPTPQTTSTPSVTNVTTGGGNIGNSPAPTTVTVHTVRPNSWKYFLFAYGINVQDALLTVQTLSSQNLRVTVYLGKGYVPTETDYACKFEATSELTWSLQQETASPTSSCTLPDDPLGEWFIGVRNEYPAGDSSPDVAFSINLFLQPKAQQIGTPTGDNTGSAAFALAPVAAAIGAVVSFIVLI